MGYTFGISPHFNAESIAAALIGGALLGSSVVFKTGVLSGVMGISNYTRRLMFQREMKRYAFCGGMILSGIVLAQTYGGVEPMPPKGFDQDTEARVKLFVRLFTGSFMVGVGAAFQHGCTSGHGLTGLARFSWRSWAAVPTFMGSGVLVGTLSNSAASLPPDAQAEADVPSWYYGAIVVAAGIVLLLITTAIFAKLAPTLSDKGIEICTLVGEFVVGITFGSGLVVSGMVRPSKVAAFLDILSGQWDLSLAFVMGGALCVTFPYFQAVETFKMQKKAVLHKTNFDIPPRNKLPDVRFLAGAACFGIGWSVCGMCPGPIWVNVGATPSWELLVAVVSMLLGLMFAELLVKTILAPPKPAPKAEAKDAKAEGAAGEANKGKDVDIFSVTNCFEVYV